MYSYMWNKKSVKGDYLDFLFLKYVFQLDSMGFVMVTEKMSD